MIELLSNLKPGPDWRGRAIKALAGKISHNDAARQLDELKAIARNMGFRFDKGLIVDLNEYMRERESIKAQIDKLAPLLTPTQELEQAASLLNHFEMHFVACGGDISKQHELIKLIVERVYIRDKQITRVVFTHDCELVLLGGDIQFVTLSHESGPYRTRTYDLTDVNRAL